MKYYFCARKVKMMFIFLIFNLSIYCVAVHSASDFSQTNIEKETYQCGTLYNGSTLQTVNGSEQRYSDFPWNVAVYNRQKVLICGGTIIHPSLILSAAHCFFNNVNKTLFNVEDYEVVVSKFTRNYSTTDNEYQKVYKIREWREPKINYYGYSTRHSDNIVILILKEKITFSPAVLPVCIDPNMTDWNYPEENTLLKVVGWGTNKKGELPEFLSAASLTAVYNDRWIQRAPQNLKSLLTLDKFCAVGAGIHHGDGGSGVLVEQSNLHYIRGIVSTKWPTEMKLALFTDVSFHIRWILKVLNEIELEDKREDFLSFFANCVPVTTSSTIEELRDKAHIIYQKIIPFLEGNALQRGMNDFF